MPAKILVADDSQSIREIITKTLQIKGYDITEVWDGSEAWQSMQENEYDLLITDVDMPKMTGTELLKKVRQESSNQSIPVVVCTAEDKKIHDELKQSGASAILRKPFSPIDLLQTVAGLLE